MAIQRPISTQVKQATHIEGVTIDCSQDGDQVVWPLVWGAVSVNPDTGIRFVEPIPTWKKAVPISVGQELGIVEVNASNPIARPKKKFFNW